jgi:3-dehydroquinate synthase
MNQAFRSLPVDLGARSYEVLVGAGLLNELGPQTLTRLGLRQKAAIITDRHVGPLYAEAAQASLESAGIQATIITVPAGEASKSMSCAQKVLSEMVNAGLDRKSLVIALGGGVIGDLAGFCASLYQRGIPYVQVPTTVLSQVDSSVGGKTGVNLPEAKNMVGAFHQPALVLADIDTLKSLPKREWNEGFAEIIKHACIRDASMLDAIQEVAIGDGDLLDLIARNIRIKARIVEADEHETLGLRALLNFGHTLGHAIEAAAGYGQLLHGEAISLGLHAALHLSCTHAGLSDAEMQRVLALLRAFELPTKLGAAFDDEQLLKITRMDKKFERGSIRFVLLNKLGEAFVSEKMTEADLRAALVAIRA